MIQRYPALFQYRVAKPGQSVMVASHRGRQLGGSELFQHHAYFMAHPDPRRLDLRVSCMDPFAQDWVKVFRQPNRMSVWVIADLSASMNKRLNLLKDFITAAVLSVHAQGDRFGFIGCGDHLSSQWMLPTGAKSQHVEDLLRRLPDKLKCRSAQSLHEIAPILSTQRNLVFLLTDGHFPLDHWRKLLSSISHHAVVPIILWDEDEYSQLPDFGWLRLRDAEQPRSRVLFMRPGLKQRIIEAFEQRRLELCGLCRNFGMEPLWMPKQYDAEALNRYFLERPC